MSYQTDAWVLHAGDPKNPSRAELQRERITVDTIRDDEVLCMPLYGSWEGNNEHALARSPLDICRVRREPWVVIGNAGVVKVLEVGSAVTQIKPGQIGMIFAAGEIDEYGYMLKALGYETPGQMGCLAKLMKIKGRQLVPIPDDTRHSLAQWAAFSVRYVTAWANWKLSLAIFRLQMSEAECPAPHVWGWGGGTTLAELELAQRHGCHTVMLSGADHHIAAIRRAGIEVIDRRTLGALSYEPERYEVDADYRKAYQAAENAFMAEVMQRTDGALVHIFLDYIGTPVFRASLRALARQGVITTAGWKEGMSLSLLRAKECIGRHQHIHTHYARYHEGIEAVAYGEEHGWMPAVGPRIYDFDEIPRLAEDYRQGTTDYFPCFRINEEDAI